MAVLIRSAALACADLAGAQTPDDAARQAAIEGERQDEAAPASW